jgi:hypothetical protein
MCCFSNKRKMIFPLNLRNLLFLTLFKKTFLLLVTKWLPFIRIKRRNRNSSINWIKLFHYVISNGRTILEGDFNSYPLTSSLLPCALIICHLISAYWMLPMVQNSIPPAIALVTREDANTAQIRKIGTDMKYWSANKWYIVFGVTVDGFFLTTFHYKAFSIEVGWLIFPNNTRCSESATSTLIMIGYRSLFCTQNYIWC